MIPYKEIIQISWLKAEWIEGEEVICHPPDHGRTSLIRPTKTAPIFADYL